MSTTLKKGDAPSRRFSLLSFGDRKDETVRTQKRTAQSFVENKHRNTQRFTITHFAASQNLKELLEYRLQNAKHLQRELEARTLSGETTLQIAIRQGHLDAVKTLLGHGAEVLIKERDGHVLTTPTTVLHEAIEQGNQERVQLLLSAKPTLSSELSPSRASAFTAAARGEKFGILKVLLPTLPTKQLQTEFAQSWFLKIALPLENLMETLLKAGALSDAHKEDILYQARELPHIWRLLLEHGANTNGHVQGKLLLQKALEDNDTAFAELLLLHGADVKAKIQGKPLLETALDNSYVHFAELLIDHGAKFTNQATAREALEVAAAQGYAKVTIFALEECGRSLSDELENHNLLKTAVASGNIETVKALLDHGIDPEARNDGNETAIFEAVRRKDLPMTELLLEKMPDLDYGTRGCPQLIQLSARWDNKEVVEKIVSRSPRSMVFLKMAAGSPLLIAAVEGNNHAALAFLEGGANVNVADSDRNTPLHFAVMTKNPIMVALAISKGARLLTRNKNGMSPLHLAVSGNDMDVQRVCFGDWDTRPFDSELSRELLLMALINGNHFATNLLLKHGLSPEVEIDEEGHKAIHIAALRGYVEIVRALVKHGADVSEADLEMRTPLWIAASRNDETEIVKLLLDAGADINQSDSKKRSPLWIALMNEHTKVATLLLEKGADLTSHSSDGVTLLHLAVDTKDEVLVKLLLSKARDVFHKLQLLNAKTSGGNTPLKIAIKNGSTSLVTTLLGAGAKGDLSEIQVLAMASEGTDVSTLKVLLDRNPSLEEATHDGVTLMTIALQQESSALLRYLADKPVLRELDIGTDAKLCRSNDNKAHMTPLMFAVAAGKISHVTTLLRAGADPKVDKGPYVNSPLHLAVMTQHANRHTVVELLLDEGANPAEKDKVNGFTALHMAVLKKDREIVEMLLRSRRSHWIVSMGDDERRIPLKMAQGIGDEYVCGADLIRDYGGQLKPEYVVPGRNGMMLLNIR